VEEQARALLAIVAYIDRLKLCHETLDHIEQPTADDDELLSTLEAVASAWTLLLEARQHAAESWRDTTPTGDMTAVGATAGSMRSVLDERAASVLPKAREQLLARSGLAGPRSLQRLVPVVSAMHSLWPEVFLPNDPEILVAERRRQMYAPRLRTACHVCGAPLDGTTRCPICGASVRHGDVHLPGPARPGSLGPY